MIKSMVKHQTRDFFIQLGNRIANARKQAGLTQKQLAQKIGVTQPVCASYETGRRRIPIPTIIKIAEALYIYVEDLLPIKLEKKKRGPVSKIDRELSKVKNLPQKEQKLVLDLLNTIFRNNQRPS